MYRLLIPFTFSRVGFLDSRLSLLLGSTLTGVLRALFSGIASTYLFDDGHRDLVGDQVLDLGGN